MTDYSFLFDLERELHTPACRHDLARLDTLLAPGFFEFGASGMVWQREDTVTKLPQEGVTEEPPAILSWDYKAVELAPNVVLVTYMADKSDNGSPSLRSSIWRANDGQWQMEFHQGTKVPSDVI